MINSLHIDVNEKNIEDHMPSSNVYYCHEKQIHSFNYVSYNTKVYVIVFNTVPYSTIMCVSVMKYNSKIYSNI